MTVIETEAAPVEAAPPRRPLTRSRRLPGWRLAARLAGREVRRRRARTALAALLVAIPVAGMVIGVAVTRFRSPLPEERWNREWGAVDIVGRDLRAEDLPPGSHVVEVRLLRTRLRTTDRRSATVDVSEVLPDEPLARDLVVVSAGRLPERADEVLLAPGAAEDLGVGVGDTVELDRPVPTRVVISGIGPLRSRQGSGWLMVVGPGSPLIGAPGEHHALQLAVLDPALAASAREDWAAAHLREYSVFARPSLAKDSFRSYDSDRLEVAGFETRNGIAGAWIGGAVALTVLGIVIVAAFAASNRRQLATVGLLGANGAPPRVVRRMLALHGAGVGVLGAAAGVVAGAAVIAARPAALAVDHLPEPPTLADLWPSDLAPVVALAVLTATVAALVPSRAITRLPVLTALAGRRPSGPVRRQVPVTGLAVAALGVAAVSGGMFLNGVTPALGAAGAVIAAAGGVAVLVGMAVATPAWVHLLDRAGSRLHGQWRLACRSLARRRGHSAAMVAAVMATAGLTTAVGVVQLMYQHDDERRGHVPGEVPADQVHLTARAGEQTLPLPASVPDRVAALLPGAAVHQLTRLVPPEGARLTDRAAIRQESGAMLSYGARDAVLADDAATSAYRLTDDARHTLADTGALTSGTGDEQGRGLLAVTQVPMTAPTPPGSPTPDEATQPIALVPPAADAPVMGATVLVTADAARTLGLTPEPGALVVDLPGPITDAQRDAVDELTAGLTVDVEDAMPPGTEAWVSANVARPASVVERPLAFSALVVAIAGGVTLLVVAIGLALAAAETRSERELLAVAGADPRQLRRTAGRQAFLLVLLGCGLGIVAGWVPLAGPLGITDGLGLVFPWRVALLLLVLPVVAGLGASVASAVALRLRPIRYSTLAAD